MNGSSAAPRPGSASSLAACCFAHYYIPQEMPSESLRRSGGFQKALCRSRQPASSPALVFDRGGAGRLSAGAPGLPKASGAAMTQTLSSRRQWRRELSVLLAQSATPATLSPAPCASCWPNRGRSGVMGLKMKFLLLLTFLVVISSLGWAKDRHYYIAIKETTWNYAPTGKNMLNGKPISEDEESQIYLQRGPDRIGRVYKKALYFQYTDGTFQKLIKKPLWLGFLGPIIKAETGDYVYVHVKNFASRMYSFHPHGLTYTKENEGKWILFPYMPELLLIERMSPTLEEKKGSRYTYKWFVQEKQGPGRDDSNCVTRIYHSHVDTTRDVASGLIGPILTCKRGTLDGDTEKYIDKFYVLMFSQTNENKSWYIDDNINTYTESGQVNASDQSFEVHLHLFSAINGYMYGNLPNITMCAEDRVKWYFIGMGDLFDIHPIYIHGQTLLSRNHRKDTITVFPASLEDAFMVAKGPGEWILGCPIYGMDLLLLHNTGSEEFQGYNPLLMPHMPNGETNLLMIAVAIQGEI
ncbi:hypothetical protein QTO34_014274 [Cnephaeus nilssonii]|uniref:Ceruloplasmin n=1 Tax=Cnephaeus nilssonii TaxID=3371016 RepID=A0AA40I690_CNENI|nr:hypothetical protein QTO34_014274 [Eptesicus nilssonii]